MSSQSHTIAVSDEPPPTLPLRVLLITNELTPFARVGGLGDMVSGLAAGLADLDVDVRVLMPRYGWINASGMYRIPRPIACEVGSNEFWTAVYEASLPSHPRVPVYFVDRLDMFDRDFIYGPNSGGYEDNDLRFALLSAAAFAVSRTLRWTPHVFHAHDWPTAPVAELLRYRERISGFAESKSVLTVHNPAHSGPDGKRVAPRPLEPFSEDSHSMPQPPGSGNGAGSVMPAGGEARRDSPSLVRGIASSDRIVFVSPSFADEVMRPGRGFGLEDTLHARRDAIHGILNGVDYRRWNPSADSFLPVQYDIDTLDKREIVRRALMREFGMPVDRGRPVIGMIARLDEQKGFRELLDRNTGSLEPLLKQNRFAFVVLGSGHDEFEQRLRELAHRYRNVGVALRFDERLAHMIEGGSDFFLMPSRYEPCGLNQIYSLRYGSIPIVSETGGLKDTIHDLSEDAGEGTGIVIRKNDPEQIKEAIERALALWQRGPRVLNAVRQRGMRERFSTEEMAKRYRTLYESTAQLEGEPADLRSSRALR